MKKEFIVKKNLEIQSIINEKDYVAEKHFILYKKENHDNNHFRFALSVSKKFGDAVHRNQMKRRIKSIIRNNKFISCLDLFIIARPSSNKLDYSTIESELTGLFKKSNVLED